MTKGKVVKNTGAHYMVETTDGTLVPCKAKGNFRIKGIRTTNPVAVGDNVTIGAPGPDGVAYITSIEPRTNYIIRRASNLSKESHILAANIDQAMLIISLAHPSTSTTFVDRFLASAQAYGIPAIIVINKIDLLDSQDDQDLLDAFTYLYQSIGYTVLHLSAQTKQGLDAVADALRDKITLLSGNSGVGKSTLINDLIPDANVKTAEISTAHDQGIHTTTFSELFHLPPTAPAPSGRSLPPTAPAPSGRSLPAGSIIDTPGIRGFGTIDFNKEEVGHYFPEIFAESKNCRFGNCTHTHEPGCAVREAVEKARIAESRYASYLSILQDSLPDKYRQ